MSIDVANLTRLVALVGEKLKQAEVETGAFDMRDYDSWSKRHRTAVNKLKEFFSANEGAVFGIGIPHDHSVRMCGIRSTSTSGYESALRNWRTAAIKKIERAGAA